MKKLMIYGATGYTGRMAAEHAKAQGLDVVIAGSNGARLASLAAQLGVPYRVFTPDAQAAESLDGIGVLLNFAGPFAQTADALMQACIKAEVDYLDITAEINVYRLAERLGAQAAEAGVMLLPGVGWDVVPTLSLKATCHNFPTAQVLNSERLIAPVLWLRSLALMAHVRVQ